MDASIQTTCLCVLIVTSIISDVSALEVCSIFLYCEDGYHCCNSNTQCCSDTVLAIGAIIGIVIGCILFIAFCIAVVCCIIKQGHRPGKVVQPAQQPGVAVFTTGHPQGQPGYGQPMYGQPGQQMYGHQPYGQQQQYGLQQPPSGDKAGTSDPAYPPPPPNY